MVSLEELTPRISVVICTRNRADKLSLTLEWWRQVRINEPAELILVDNGSIDSTAEIIHAFIAAASLPTKYVKCEKPGLARSRNVGIASARGELITFTDDDCYPLPDFLEQLVHLFDSRPEISLIGGRVLLYDPSDLRTSIQERDTEDLLPAHSVVRAGHMHGANLSVRSEAIKRIGLFDERLGAGTPLASAEDTDFIARASWQGLVGLYHPGPTVYHHHERKGADTLAHMRKGYAIGRGGYLLKFVLSSKTRRPYLRFWLSKIRWEPTLERGHEALGAWRMLLCMLRKSG